MDEKSLRKTLSALPLKGIRFYGQIGSTNDLALAWASDGAPDLSLICADEQTTGRGRLGRTWFTPPGAALAFSLILRPSETERRRVGWFSGLGALALVEALKKRGIAAQIKWPNDVLINGRKVAGILIESVWTGAEVDSIVLGMGINVNPGAIPPDAELTFPATSIESELRDAPVDRLDLLRDVLAELITWRPKMSVDEFLAAWEDVLAFRGRTVRVQLRHAEEIVGQVAGLENDGSLRLKLEGGETRAVRFGDVHLRPL
jgi:BirA family biotin operon repressor/biotin-[acetyl-CoA-carboxylase] ligase